MIDLSQHPDAETVQRLKLAEIESKRKQFDELSSDIPVKENYEIKGRID